MMRLNISPRSRGVALAGSLGVLAACGDSGPGLGLLERSGGGLFPGLTAPDAPATLLTRVALAGGVEVVAPTGWCIEPHSLKEAGRRGFALLLGCRALSEGQQGPRVARGVLTVAVSPSRAAAGAVTPEVLAAAASDASVVSQEVREGVALLHMRPAVAATEQGLGDPHWRAILVHDGHAVSLAAYGPEGGEISGRAGRALLMVLARGVRGSGTS